MVKKKVNVRKHKRKGHKRVKDGKVEEVKPAIVKEHSRLQNIPNLNEKLRNRITKGEAKKLFQKRSERAKKIDLELETDVMFAYPNEVWANNINRYDIYGLDGFNPPKVEELPSLALPYQVVEYNGQVWKANAKGKFTVPEDLEKKSHLKGYSFKEFDNEDRRERFEELTGKNAIWHDKITKQYKEWLKQEYKLDKIAQTLNFRHNKMPLHKVRDFYHDLDLPEDNLKRVFYNLYNKYYPDSMEIKSYTTDFKDFYNRRYDDVLQTKISAWENKIKEMNKDPKLSKQATESYYSEDKINFRMHTLRKMLASRDYTVISDKNLLTTLKSHPEWENRDIILDLITRYKKGDLIDSDIPNVAEADERDRKKWEEMADHYLSKESEQLLDYQILNEIEDEFREKFPDKNVHSLTDEEIIDNLKEASLRKELKEMYEDLNYSPEHIETILQNT